MPVGGGVQSLHGCHAQARLYRLVGRGVELGDGATTLLHCASEPGRGRRRVVRCAGVVEDKDHQFWTFLADRDDGLHGAGPLCAEELEDLLPHRLLVFGRPAALLYVEADFRVPGRGMPGSGP